MSRNIKLVMILFAVGILAFLLLFPMFAGSFHSHILILVFLNVVLATGYRLLYETGRGSFCHITFFAIGSYTSAILGLKLGLPYPVCLIAAGIVSAIIAALVGYPAMRVKGVYFFLVTFAFFEIMTTVFKQWESLTGGNQGLINIPGIAPMGSLKPYYYLALGLMLITIIVMYRLDRSRFGAELLALGENDELSESVGINIKLTRIIAFSLGAMFAGFAGSVSASYLSYISPSSFSMLGTIYVLIWVVVGGHRKLWGAIAGAILMTVFAEMLRMSGTLQAVLYGAVLTAAMVMMPGGLVGLAEDMRRRFGKGDRQKLVISNNEEQYTS